MLPQPSDDERDRSMTRALDPAERLARYGPTAGDRVRLADTDLWVRVQDVSPDSTAWNLMYPGSDVIRASYRDRVSQRALLDSGRVYLLKIPGMLTGNTFKRGHRVRVQLSTTFFPYFSRNLHTGASEAESTESRTARITIHHDSSHPSRIILPVMGRRE